MPKYSAESDFIIKRADPQLQLFGYELIKHVDHKVLCSFRGKEDQDKAVAAGNSQLQWPNSKHNVYPARAIDIVPYWPDSPHIRWDDLKSFYFLAGYAFAVADKLGIKIKWGGTWLTYPSFTKILKDSPHWELT